MKDLQLVEQLLTLTFHSCYLSCVHVVSRKDGKVCVWIQGSWFRLLSRLCPLTHPPHKSVADVMSLSLVFDWKIGMFPDFPCVSQTRVSYETWIWQGAYFWTPISLSKPGTCPSHQEGRLFPWNHDVVFCRYGCRGLLVTFRLIHPSLHPNKPNAYCLNTVTLRICLEKDQTKSTAPVF